MNRNKVEDVLFAMGIPANAKGFKYIIDAVEIISRDGTGVLYPEVADMNHTTPTRAERAIRHAFEIASSNRGDYEVFEKYIGHINTNNGAALTSLYKRIKREEEEEKAEMAKQIVGINPELESMIRNVVREELQRMAALDALLKKGEKDGAELGKD